MGIALLTMATLEILSYTGFHESLIQKRGDIRSYLDSAWTILILRGFILFIIIYLIAPYVALFFNVAEAKIIVQVVGLSILIQGFTNIGVIYFQKELEFKKEFICQFLGTLADFVVAVSAVLILGNVWALVYGLLAGNTMIVIASYFIHPYRPRIRFDLIKTKELWVFGRWMFGATLINFLFNYGDDAFLGRILGVTALGFYQTAYRIGQLPATEFAKVVSKVAFPAYSKLQDDAQRLWRGFSKTLSITALLTIPLIGGVFLLGREFTVIFLGDKWLPIVPVLNILVVAGVTRALIAAGGALFQGKGIPNINLRLNTIRLFTMAITIYPLTLIFNINGVALSVVLGNLSCFPFWFKSAIEITDTPLKEYLKIISPPFLGTIIMSLSIFLTKGLIEINALTFVLIVLIGFLTYLVFMYIFEKVTKIRILDELRSLFYLTVSMKKYK